MSSLRYHIKNFRGRFTILVAMDFGRCGGCSAEDYMPLSQTAWAQRFPEAAQTFEFEQQAQYALGDFRAGLESYWKAIYQKASDAKAATYANLFATN